MSSLRTLHVGDNRLQELPHELCQCKALTELRAPRNALQSLPPAFGRLERLTTLDLRCERGGVECCECPLHLNPLLTTVRTRSCDRCPRLSPS